MGCGSEGRFEGVALRQDSDCGSDLPFPQEPVLGYALLMALLLAMLHERRVRRSLKTEGEPIMSPGKRMTMQPTARMILEMLDTAHVTHIE